MISKLKISKNLKKSNAEIAVIYSSIAQTYQDLDNYKEALKYFEFELKTSNSNDESVLLEEKFPRDYLLKLMKILMILKTVKTLLNIAYAKEKCQAEFEELDKIYADALESARKTGNQKLQVIRLI